MTWRDFTRLAISARLLVGEGWMVTYVGSDNHVTCQLHLYEVLVTFLLLKDARNCVIK